MGVRMKIIAMAVLMISVVCFSDDLTTNIGKTYKNYSVRRVTENGIHIMHSQGGCIVPFEQLPDDVRAKYRSQEEKILAEQRQKKLEEEKRERLRKIRDERRKALKNIEFTTILDIQVIKVLDKRTCIVYVKKTLDEFIITEIDTTNLADGGVLPFLYHDYENHNFSASISKHDGKYVLDRYRGYYSQCQFCGMQVTKTKDKNKFYMTLYHLQKIKCPKGIKKQHRFYYVGTRIYRNRKYMVFTFSQIKALKFAKAHPNIHIPKMREPPRETIILSTPVGPRTTVPTPGISPHSMRGQMLQGRNF